MVRLFATASTVLLVAAAMPAFAADTAPSTIVANPSAYEGKSVSVSGTVAKYQTTKTPMGTVAAYQLCDAKCVVVIDETAAAHKDGDTVTAAGTFKSTFTGRQRSFKNVVLIK